MGYDRTAAQPRCDDGLGVHLRNVIKVNNVVSSGDNQPSHVSNASPIFHEPCRLEARELFDKPREPAC
jgi:hypothetical protein